MSNLSKNNTSGFRGVSYESKAKKYRAYIHYAGQKLPLGYFTDVNDAAKAREDAQKLFKTKTTNGQYLIIEYLTQHKGLSRTQAERVLKRAIIRYDFSLSFPVYTLRLAFSSSGDDDEDAENRIDLTQINVPQNAVFEFLNGASLRRFNHKDVLKIKAFFNSFKVRK